MDDTLMIDPFLFLTIIGIAYLQHKNVPVRLTAIVAFQTSSLTSAIGPSSLINEMAEVDPVSWTDLGDIKRESRCPATVYHYSCG